MEYPLIQDPVSKNNFDLLRFLLAASVIYSHCFVVYHGKTIDTEPFMIFSQNQMDLGSLAVDCFFIISGFLIFRSYERSRVKNYLVNRFLRIFPGFWVAFLISLLIVGPLSTITANFPHGELIKYFSGLEKKLALQHLFTLQKPIAPMGFQSLPLPKMVNEPLWTIQYEFVCYLILPLVGLFKIIRWKRAALIIFIVSYIILLLQNFWHFEFAKNYNSQLLSTPIFYPRFFVYFFSGALFYLYRTQIPSRILLVILAVASLVFSCVGYPCINLVMPFSGAYLLFYIAYHPKLPFSNFAQRGDFSYGTYLYAWPIQQSLFYFLDIRLGPNRLFALTLPLTVLAAVLSWNLIEKPFLKMKQKNKKEAMAPSPGSI